MQPTHFNLIHSQHKKQQKIWKCYENNWTRKIKTWIWVFLSILFLKFSQEPNRKQGFKLWKLENVRTHFRKMNKFITLRVFLAFLWARTNKTLLLSGNFTDSLTVLPKLWKKEEELHDSVAAVDDDAAIEKPQKLCWLLAVLTLYDLICSLHSLCSCITFLFYNSVHSSVF